MGKRRDYTQEEKERVYRLWLEGYTYKGIDEETGFGFGQVRNLIQHGREAGVDLPTRRGGKGTPTGGSKTTGGTGAAPKKAKPKPAAAKTGGKPPLGARGETTVREVKTGPRTGQLDWRVSLWLPEETARTLALYATTNLVSQADVVVDALRRYLKKG